MTDREPKVFRVSEDQVSAARALVNLHGLDRVSPMVAKIAHAKPAPRPQESDASRAS